MAWHVENESRHRPPALPEKQRRLGDVTVEWIEAKPGEAAIICTGGSIDDRWLAEVVTREELFACGIRQAKFSFDQQPPPNLWTRKGTESWGGEMDRKPFFYNPDDHTIYLGNLGNAHQDIHDELGHPGYDFEQYHYGGLYHDPDGKPQFAVNYDTNPARTMGEGVWQSVLNRLGVGMEDEPYEDDLWHESSAGESGEDQFFWQPGQFGKGILTQDGVMHAWSTGWDVDGHPWHTDYAREHGIDENSSTRFRIHPDGDIGEYSNPSYVKHDPEKVMHYFRQHVPEAGYKGMYTGDASSEDWASDSPESGARWRAFSKTASWDDIMAKAKRLIQSGNVTLLRNGYNNVVAHVIGDHGEYQCEISRDDPESRAITQWTCECPWDQYAFQRTRQWKKYEARPCAHVLAAYWKSQGTPLDEDAPPGASPNGGPAPFPQQPQAPVSPFAPQMPAQGPEQGLQPGPDGGAMPGLPPAAQMEGPPQLGPPSALPPVGNPPQQPDALNPQFMPPAQTGLIPPYPLEPAPQPVSVPGARPGPYPANPVQQPGTFSHTYRPRMAAEFQPETRARLNEATLGTSVGRDGAIDAGRWMEIPEGANVEIIHQDPTTGWVEIRYPLKGGAMTSYHVECFVEPEKLAPLEGDSPMAPRRRL